MAGCISGASASLTRSVDAYGRMLNVVLRFSFVTLLVLIATIALTGFLYVCVPKGFFPQQDTGRLNGAIQADQDSSFQLMNNVLLQMIDIVKTDPAVANVVGFTGGAGTTNMARLFVALKPLDQRDRVPIRSSRGCGRSWRRCLA